MDFKKYQIRKNCRDAFGKYAGIMGVRYPAAMGGNVALSVIQPFAAMALPSAVVYLLGSGREPEIIFILLAGYVLILQAMQIARGYLSGVDQKGRFLLRISMGTELFGAVMDADFQELESGKGQKKLRAGMPNIYSGNSTGIEAYLGAWGDAVVALSGLIVYSVIIGRIRIWILLLLFLVAGLVMAVNLLADRRKVIYEEKYVKASNQDLRYLKRETLVPASGKDIRIYRMWDWFQKEFDKINGEMAHWIGKVRNCRTGAASFGHAAAFARDLLVYGYLIGLMGQGEIDLAAFLLYVGIVASFSGQMSALTEAVNTILENSRPMNHYREFLEFSRAKHGGNEAPANPGRRHEIRLEHVSFRYEGSGEDAVRDLSLTIKPGEKIALVGVNGAGKSTLVKLICGLYRPTSGRILLDGQDVRKLSPEAYRKEFSVVFQDVFAFAFALSDNVSCKAPEETDPDRLAQSLRDADLWERVQKMERKEQTSVGRELDEQGVTLSGGEMQRLMLARALYKDAPVVILDEPTAALDPIAESGMYEKYYEMTREKTSIFISHRLSSTRFCDRILFMEDGRITEEGNHEKLMEKQGAYAFMFHTQAQYYEAQGSGAAVFEDGGSGEPGERERQEGGPGHA